MEAEPSSERSPGQNFAVLPSSYKLLWYELESVLGRGGFGITYLAWDTNLNQRVAIKEFLPTELAVRTTDRTVHPLSAEHEDVFNWGLSRFIEEAQTLARFSHPSIVQVRSVFEANNTAYMVMDYVEGLSFSRAMRSPHYQAEPELKRILFHLLDGVELIHKAGFIHRDIKPDNIFLQETGIPVLLDFGSARESASDKSRTLTALVTPGYAPFEQYDTSSAADRQGPWTDIYALGALLYRTVTGKAPIDAMARMAAQLDGKEVLEPASQIGGEAYSPKFLAAIDHALAFRPTSRPQSIAAWRAELGGEEEPSHPETPHMPAGDNAPTVLRPSTRRPTRTPTRHPPSGAPAPVAPAEARTENVPPYWGDSATGDAEDTDSAPTNLISQPASRRASRPVTRPLTEPPSAPSSIPKPDPSAGYPASRSPESGYAPIDRDQTPAQSPEPAAVAPAGTQSAGKILSAIVALIVVAGAAGGTYWWTSLREPPRAKLEPLPAALDYHPIRTPSELVAPQISALNELARDYQAVLALDPSNATAQREIALLARDFAELAEFSREHINNQVAAEVIAAGLSVAPGDPSLLEGQSALLTPKPANELSAADRDKLERWVALAKQDLEELRLVEPPGNNAAARLKAIRSLDPANQFAGQQLERLGRFFHDQAYAAFVAGDVQKGARKLEQGLLISPRHPDLLALHQAASARMNKSQ